MKELLGDPVTMFNVMFLGGIIIVVQLIVSVISAVASALVEMVERKKSIERKKEFHKAIDSIVTEAIELSDKARKSTITKKTKVANKK